MKYSTYKVIVSDDPGAKYVEKLAEKLTSEKFLDELYEGPTNYWCFHQLGDFIDLEMMVIKWNIWTNLYLKNEKDQFNKSSFIGSQALLGFYDPTDVQSFEGLKKSMEEFDMQRKKQFFKNPIVVMAIHDGNNNDIDKEEQQVFKDYEALVISLSEENIGKSLDVLMLKWFSFFVSKIDPTSSEVLNISSNWWNVSLDNLKNILLAIKKGIKIPSRHRSQEEILAEKEKLRRAEIKRQLEIQAFKEKKRETLKKEKADAGQKEEVFEAHKVDGFKERKLSLEDLSEEDMKNIAIGPNGEIFRINNDITQEEIVELIKKGYKLPLWVVIPRHCPNCYNQNQRAIREVIDKTNILMQNPTIYGMKLVCGICGTEWVKNELNITH